MNEHPIPSSRKNLSGLAWIWLLIAAAGLLLSRILFAGGMLISGDNPSHLAEIYALRDVVVPQQGWWTGWFEGDYAGYPLLTYQYPIGKWLVLLAALLPGIDIPASYKLLLVISWLFPVLVLSALLRFRGISSTTLAAVALMYLGAFDSLYFSLAGMWNQYLSAGFFLLAVASMVRLLKAPGPAQTAKTSAWCALTAVSHQFMLLLLPITWFSALIVAAAQTGRLRRENLRCLLLVPVLSFLLSAWYFYPVFLTWDWPQLQTAGPGWFDVASSLFPLAASDLIRPATGSWIFSRNFLLFSSGMVAALAAGAAGFYRIITDTLRGKQVDPLFHMAAGIFAGVSALIGLVFWQPFPFLNRVLLTVGSGRLAIYLLLSLLAAAAYLLQGAEGAPGKPVRRNRAALLLSLLLMPLLLRAIVSPQFPHSEVRLLFQTEPSSHPELAHIREIWEWLRRNADPKEGRLFCQDTSYNLQDSPLFWSHFLALSHRHTGLWTLGTLGRVLFPTDLHTQTQGAMVFGRPVSKMTVEELNRQMQLYNCRYALTCEPALTRLLESSGQFERVLGRGRFSLFRSQQLHFWSDWPAGEGTIVEEEVQHHRRSMRVKLTGSPEAALRIKTAYHPWWTARVDGAAVPAQRSKPDLLLLVPIRGKGEHLVELEFRPPKVVPALLTLLGAIACSWLVIMKPPRR